LPPPPGAGLCCALAPKIELPAQGVGVSLVDGSDEALLVLAAGELLVPVPPAKPLGLALEVNPPELELDVRPAGLELGLALELKPDSDGDVDGEAPLEAAEPAFGEALESPAGLLVPPPVVPDARTLAAPVAPEVLLVDPPAGVAVVLTPVPGCCVMICTTDPSAALPFEPPADPVVCDAMVRKAIVSACDVFRKLPTAGAPVAAPAVARPVLEAAPDVPAAEPAAPPDAAELDSPDVPPEVPAADEEAEPAPRTKVPVHWFWVNSWL